MNPDALEPDRLDDLETCPPRSVFAHRIDAPETLPWTKIAKCAVIGWQTQRHQIRNHRTEQPERNL